VAERMLTLGDVRDRTTFSKTHIYRLINAGSFPRPVKIGPRRIAFVEREIDQWLTSRVEAREDRHG